MRASKHPLKHVGYLRQRHDALRSPCLKYRCGTLLDPWQMKEMMRRVVCLARKSCPFERQT
jgi:hypothetical protein